MAPAIEITKLAMIGCGSMGGGMALLFAEKGIDVGLQDPSEETIDKLVEQAKKDGVGERVKKYTDYKSLTKNLGSPKVIVFSLPHGDVGDEVLGGLLPYLVKGDIIIDAGNEHWENTERRQGKCYVRGIRYVGMGVSGGYQAARRGPSMCPGGDDETLDMVLPLLEKAAAKDPQGKACVGKAGSGGSGHYVKMVHNGIEHGMMSAIAEAWQILEIGLDLKEDDIADIFEQWNKEGEFRNTFLISIGAQILRQVDPKDSKQHLLPQILDKVVQDLTGEEGTGLWSSAQAVLQHIPAPTLTVAHYFRLASAYRANRETVSKNLGNGWPQRRIETGDKKAFIEGLRKATYLACLVSYVQGIHLILKADQAHHWNIDLNAVLQIWKAGCIIQADYVSELLKPIFEKFQREKEADPSKELDLLKVSSIGEDVMRCYQSLRTIVLAATESDAIIPSISASLEYVKYQSNTNLPTSFYEAELDFFGNHMFDRKGEKGTGGPSEGKHHFEWRPA